jgi:hypothetical protein
MLFSSTWTFVCAGKRVQQASELDSLAHQQMPLRVCAGPLQFACLLQLRSLAKVLPRHPSAV